MSRYFQNIVCENAASPPLYTVNFIPPRGTCSKVNSTYTLSLSFFLFALSILSLSSHSFLLSFLFSLFYILVLFYYPSFSLPYHSFPLSTIYSFPLYYILFLLSTHSFHSHSSFIHSFTYSFVHSFIQLILLMCVCICICICICVCLCMYVHVYMHMCMYVYTYMYVCVYVYVRMYVCTYVCVRTYMCMRIGIGVCVHMGMHIGVPHNVLLPYGQGLAAIGVVMYSLCVSVHRHKTRYIHAHYTYVPHTRTSICTTWPYCTNASPGYVPHRVCVCLPDRSSHLYVWVYTQVRYVYAPCS